ncbi:hypothetical protein ANCCAN_17839 [Ancylostoma caninum]|uniref:Uncharacterized protein n=1 Tax=Ancylostoma caninum TaxID=29170 RepID=A0A368FVR8_ANCCA|nr:hypothetical protein ANCCAN_17839 [Ancylostoma caninum]
MFLTSYFDPRQAVQDDKYCGISGRYKIGAFSGSAFAFFVARNIRKHANKGELSSIQPILVVSFISCIVTSSDNIVYILKHVAKIDIAEALQNYVVTYSSSAFQVSKFALYLLTGKEFRDCLRKVIKIKKSPQQTQTQTFVTPASVMKNNYLRR